MSFLPLRALAIVGLSLVISACGGALSAAQGPGELGKKAPSLSIQSLNGKGEVSLSSLSGKVTVVEFWATWCEPCKKSLIQLEELRTRSGGNIEVIAISVDDTSSGVEEFAKAQGLTFPIAWDEHHSLMWRWSVEAMPTTFILDGKGRIRFVHEPDKKQDQADLIARELAQLTDEGAPSDAKTEVASATPPAAQRVALAVAVVDPTPSVPPTTAAPSTDETTAAASPSEAPQGSKPRAKPSAGKKGVAKKTKKK
ncbi:MAG: thioredoxin family protein [Myxococcaceae bacterium]|nr:thioredoxin family protein [Myxococcaceae bacterium]